MFLKTFFSFLVTSLSLTALAGNTFESRHAHPPYSGPILPSHSSVEDSTPTVYLYDDKGVWDEGREHLKMFMNENHFSYQTIQSKDVLAGILKSVPPKILIMPGGESWEYLSSLKDPGKNEILNYVTTGGSYIGICAGAFYATSHRLGGYATGPYGIGLLQGTAYDGTALNTPPFKEGMMDIKMFVRGFPEIMKIVMFGGPSFRFDLPEQRSKKIVTLAQFPEVNEPAMIRFEYGKGKVFLTGPHLEIEEDRTNWGPEFKDPDSEWPLLNKVVSSLL